MLIFNFHHIKPRAAIEAGLPDHKAISMTPEGLARFISTLRLLGLKPVSLREVLEYGPTEFSHRHCLLTFDDGYENFFLEALPVLTRLKCPATVFILAGKVGESNDWDRSPKATVRDPLLRMDQIRMVAESPWVQLASHGWQHRNLVTLFNAKTLAQELAGSYEYLTGELALPVLPVFAYPWGSVNQTVYHAMKQTPYRYGVTTWKGYWHPEGDPYLVPRFSAYLRDASFPVLLLKLLRNLPYRWRPSMTLADLVAETGGADLEDIQAFDRLNAISTVLLGQGKFT